MYQCGEMWTTDFLRADWCEPRDMTPCLFSVRDEGGVTLASDAEMLLRDGLFDAVFYGAFNAALVGATVDAHVNSAFRKGCDNTFLIQGSFDFRIRDKLVDVFAEGELSVV